MAEWIDGHIHITPELLPYLGGVRCIANADHPEEYRFLKAAGLPGLVISAGIHPWKADATQWEDMEPILQKVDVIGEIGLDSEWCTVDMALQRQVFRRQLELAAARKRPVILHTKGMERAVLEIIRCYPNRYLVHWYSCADWQQDYIDQGCWFTIGPDVSKSEAVKMLAERVPPDKILIESDGLEGLAWAHGAEIEPHAYPCWMEKQLAVIAGLRGETAETLRGQLARNFDAFLSGAGSVRCDMPCGSVSKP